MAWSRVPFVLPLALLHLLRDHVGEAAPVLRVVGSSTVLPVAKLWARNVGANYTFVDGQGQTDTCTLAADGGQPEVKNSTLCGGSSESGASRVCLPRTWRGHVDIGMMSREWIMPPAEGAEAVVLDDGYTYECTNSQVRVTQMNVGVDGLAVSVSRSGPAQSCLLVLGGLTLAQLRWIFSSWSDQDLASNKDGGVDVASVAPNDNHNGIKEWSDFSHLCDQRPINPYGGSPTSGTASFFANAVMCASCFANTAGYLAEDFNNCAQADNSQLLATTSRSQAKAWIGANRKPNCYLGSDDENQILDWLVSDPSGVGFQSFALFSKHQDELGAARIAADRKKGVEDTLEAVIQPDVYSITDGSYSVFQRKLYMNVDVTAWALSSAFFTYGYSDAGQVAVEGAGFVTVNAALRAKLMQRVVSGGNPKADYVSTPPANCPVGEELLATPYVSMFGADKVNYTCSPCKPGYSKRDSAPAACTACTKGTFAGKDGQALCTFCPPGRFSGDGAAVCTPCPKNQVTEMPGLSQCTVCDIGYFTAGEGNVACDRCSFGTYRGSSDVDCMSCPAGMTTLFQAATTHEDCMCARGSYHAPGGRENGPCLPCPEGMECAFGSQYDNYANWTAGSGLIIPMLKPDYWSTEEKPLSVFFCRFELHPCPGGGPLQCNGGREGPLCATCPLGQTFKKGECQDCGNHWTSMVVLGPVGVTLLVVVCYYTTNDPVTSNVSVANAIVMTLSMFLTIMQVLALYKDLGVDWAGDIRNLLEALSLTLASPTTMREECVLGQKAVSKYLFRCMVPVMLLVDLVLLWFITHVLAVCRMIKFRAWDPDKTLNTMAQILQAFFIGLTAIMVVPLMCYPHPNGKRSVIHYPDIVCWESPEHKTLLGLGFAVACIFVAPFVAFCVLGTHQVIKPNKPRFFRRFRFLLFRFRPDVWWWGNVFLLRQLMLAFAPSLPSQSPYAQLIYVISVLTVYGLAQAHYFPWKAPEFNLLDLLSTIGLVMVATVSSTLMERPDSLEMYGAVLLTVIFVLAAGSAALVMSVCYYAFRFGVRGKLASGKASFGAEGVDHTQLAEQFYMICSTVKELGYTNCKATLDDMNYYDRLALRNCTSSYQACNRVACPSGKLPRARLAGLPRSDSGSSTGSNPIPTSGSWRDANGEMVATKSNPTPQGIPAVGGDPPGFCEICGRDPKKPKHAIHV